MYRGIPNQDITKTNLQGHACADHMTLCNMLSLYIRYYTLHITNLMANTTYQI